MKASCGISSKTMSTASSPRSVSIVTWNLNSIRSRLTHLLDFLQRHQPDIVLLQELKAEETKFPYIEIEDMGYNCAVSGQKTYNGVAILSKSVLDDVVTFLYEDDEQARYIEATTSVSGQVLRIASVYVPNGQAVDSDKFIYKQTFMHQLDLHMQRLLSYEEMTIIGGDYNIAYLPDDVYHPSKLDGSICYHPLERAALRNILYRGYYDAYRCLHPDAKHAYSWWDYRGGKYDRDEGYRIDHLLLSAEATDCLQHCEIIREERAKEKPSDHAPVMCTLKLDS